MVNVLKTWIGSFQDFLLLSSQAIPEHLSEVRTTTMMSRLQIGYHRHRKRAGCTADRIFHGRHSRSADGSCAQHIRREQPSRKHCCAYACSRARAVLTAILVAGRNASGMASELGSMKVTEQIDAMRALGTDPVQS